MHEWGCGKGGRERCNGNYEVTPHYGGSNSRVVTLTNVQPAAAPVTTPWLLSRSSPTVIYVSKVTTRVKCSQY